MKTLQKVKDDWALTLTALGIVVALGAWLFPVTQPVPPLPQIKVMPTQVQDPQPINIAEANLWSEFPDRGLFILLGISSPDWTYRFIVVANVNSPTPLTGCHFDFRTTNGNGVLYSITSTSSNGDKFEYEGESFATGLETKDFWLGTKRESKLNLEALRVRARCEQFSGPWHDVDLSKGLRGN